MGQASASDSQGHLNVYEKDRLVTRYENSVQDRRIYCHMNQNDIILAGTNTGHILQYDLRVQKPVSEILTDSG